VSADPVNVSGQRTSQPERDEPGGVFRAELAVGQPLARQARLAVRQALAAWGIDDPSGEAELLASGLVANAAEHTGTPIRSCQPGLAHERVRNLHPQAGAAGAAAVAEGTRGRLICT